MRIESIRVESFGALRDREIAFSPGLNAVYGKNESGKTTVMEFMRSAASPDRKRTRYPERDKRDAGSMRVVMDDGSVAEPSLDRPMAQAVDPATFRSVFAMASGDLRDSKIITSGDVKSRFLTVPGGEGVPGAKARISQEMQALLTESRVSDGTEIGRRIKRRGEIERDLAADRGGERYDELFAERAEAEKRLEEARAGARLAGERERADAVRRSQRGSLERIEALRREAEALSASEIVGEGDAEEYARLKGAADGRSGALRDLAAAGPGPAPPGLDAAALKRREAFIREIPARQRAAWEMSRRRAEMSAAGAPAARGRAAPLAWVLISAGIAALAAGIALQSVIVAACGAAAAAAGAVCAAIGLKGAGRSPPPAGAAEAERLDREISAFRSEVEAAAMDAGLDPREAAADPLMLARALDSALARERAAEARRGAEIAERDARSELREFLSRFGGEERFLALARDRKRRAEALSAAEALEEAVRASGYWDLPPEEPGAAPMEAGAGAEGISRRLGEISREMEEIRGDRRMERLRDEKALLDSELAALARRWGTLSLAESILDEACGEIFSGVQPAVVARADSFLALMTGGRYRLDSDPRNSDVSVASEGGSKREGQWSSGLGDQIMLSLKMAVASELSAERMPLILDDVLLTFDGERKRGACAALAEMAKGAQVLLFTCDTETLSLMREAGAAVTEL
ncbi:MAG: AAA family ATPase [Candidatus Methanoplasma sp.]|jgi:uncharacterized protein YhaN|nr:AAA family ATPase [Candidatus Methanoplasma sp.]